MAVYNELVVRAWPLAFPGSPRQVLGLTINGQTLGSIELERRRQTYTFSIPDGSLVAGRNLFDFSFSFLDSPARAGVGADRRSLAAALDYLELGRRTTLPDPAGEASAERPAIRNVLLISVDTLRADRLGCYGYERDTSPALDRLAAEGIRFSQAISPSPWTTPSHMSLMTSLAPSSHRVNQGWADLAAFREAGGGYRVLPESAVTLAEVLLDHGFRTLALTGGTTMAGDLGFAQGFQEFREAPPRLGTEHRELLAEWLTDVREQPFFLFFHTFEVHAPYSGLDFAEPWMSAADREDLERLLADRDAYLIPAQREFLKDRGLFRSEVTSALYDGGIRIADAFLGRLFDELRRQELYDQTLIVVTSDHGEEFADHDDSRFFDAHCTTVYDELLRVPLIFRVPSWPRSGVAVTHPVELIDVAPTILDLLGVPVPLQMQGRSLKRLLAGEPATNAVWALSEAWSARRRT